MRSVGELLAADAKARVNLPELFIFEDAVAATDEYEYGDYTIVNSARGKHKEFKINTSAEFVAAFAKEFPSFPNMDNLFIAGGAVCNMIMNGCMINKDHPNDIDIFVYGLDEASAEERIYRFIKELVGKQSFHYIRTAKVITFYADCDKYQIILRLYESKSQILHGFDIGSCAVGFDGKNILTTTLGAFAYKNRLNVLDLTRRSTTYETRLSKYMMRNKFGIVLTGIPKACIPEWFANDKENTFIRLKYCTIYKSSMNGKKIIGRLTDKLQLVTADYDESEKYFSNDICDSTYFNCLKMFVAEETGKHEFVYITTILDEINTHPPNISEVAIYKYFEGIKTKIRAKKMQLTKCVDVLKNHKEWLIEYVMMYQKDPDAAENFLCDRIDDIANSYISLVQKYAKYEPIKWHTINPGTQISGSFNPAVVTHEEWYDGSAPNPKISIRELLQDL